MPPVLAVAAAVVGAVTEVVADIGIAGTIVGSTVGGVVGGAVGEAIGGYLGATLFVDGAALFALSTASSLLEGKPPIGGTQVEFIADPQTGVPYAIGRTGTGGNIVMTDSAGTNSAFLTYITVLSLGPIQAFESFQANTILTQFTADNGEGAGTQNGYTTISTPVSAGATVVQVGNTNGFKTGDTVTISLNGVSETKSLTRVDQSPKEFTFSSGLAHSYGEYASVTGASVQSGFINRMWRKTSVGGPEAPALTFTSTDSKDTPKNHSGIPAVWDASCKLSGLAATMWTLEYDAQVYSGGTPRPLNVIRGVLCYDPRQDSTYPGGSGSCQASQDSTWVYSENPYIHALTWLIGRTTNGVKSMGVHAPLSAIDIDAFVAGANIADANGWKCGGVVMSTDSKWDVLTSLLQAGGGTPLKLGAKISCMVNTPLVSLATMTSADVVGKATIANTTPSRDRINAVWPRYREEQQDWQIVPTATPIIVSDYVTVDGGQRTKEITYSLVQSATQAAQLARYDIENAREIQPISLPCKPIWMGYKPGDCITINEPEFGFENQTFLIISREVDPSTLTTTLGLRTETYGKHAFALGQTNVAPVTPSMNGFDPSVFAAPGIGAWTAAAATIFSNGTTLPVINVTGASDNPLAATVIVEYSPSGSGDWVTFSETAASTTTLVQITGLGPGVEYDVGVRYRSVKGVVSDRTVISGTGLANLAGSYGAYLGSGAGDTLANISYGGGLLYTADLLTSQGTSASTLAVGSTPSATVLANIAAAAAAASTALSNITAINTTLTAAVTAAQSDATSALSDISTADANLLTEISNRTAGDNVNATAIASLSSTVTSNNTAITASLSSEAGTRASADSTIAAEITTLTTNYGALSSTVSSNYTSLSTAQATTAAAVTTLQSQFGALTSPGANLVSNPSWSQGLTNWTTSGAAVFAAQPNNAGGPCIVYQNSTSGTVSLSGLVEQTSPCPAQPSGVYSLQVECISFVTSGSGAIVAGVIWNLSGGGTSTTTISITDSDNAWEPFTLPNITAPSNAVSFTPFVGLASATITTGGVVAFRQFKVELGAACSPYSDDQIGASLTAEAVTRASADSALSSQITTLTSDYSGLSSTVSTNYTTLSTAQSTLATTVTNLTSTVGTNNTNQSAAITAEATTRATADTTLTNSINTLTSNYGALSSTVSTNAATAASANSATATQVSTLQTRIAGNNNLVPYGNFEQGIGYGWIFNPYGATYIGTAQTYADPNYGNLAFLGGLTGGTMSIYSERIAVNGGQTYTVSGNIQINWNGVGSSPTGMQIYLDVFYYNSSNTLVLDGAENDGIQYTLNFASGGPNYVHTEVAPSGAVSCVVRLIAAAASFPGGGSAANVYAQKIKLETGPTWTPFSTEATVQSISSVATTLQGQTATYLEQVSTSGGTATVQLLSTSSGITEVLLQARNIYFGANISADETTNTLRFDTGGYAKIIGVNFGAGGNLVEWFGPSGYTAATASTSNAIAYLTGSGSAYFGGNLAAGSITTGNLASGAASAIVETTWSAGFALNSLASSGITSVNVTSTGGKHQITAQLTVAASGASNTGVSVTLSRDGTNVSTRNVLFPNSFTSSHLVAFYDVPGAGAHTYVIAVALTTGSSTTSTLQSIDLMSIEFRQAG